ncbi:MAG: NUDIX hydrolase [Sphingobium sp.]
MSNDGDPADDAPGVAAATLILFSERDDQRARHLMIQRTAKMRFAPNALVFPGGQVDADDHRIAEDPDLVDVELGDSLERAHRVTAIREMLEEVGVPVGFERPDSIDVPAMQAELKRRLPFSDILKTASARLDLSGLRLWAQWHPRLAHRRFDTRFYIARYKGDHEVFADADEVGEVRWLAASEAIAEAEAGSAKIIFPTLCNLERLSAYPDFAAAAAHLATVECRPISPRLHNDEQGNPCISIPEDSGYPLTRRLLSTLQAP